MVFRKIESAELNKVARMYDSVLDQQEHDEYGPKWTRGIYPCKNDFIEHLENGEFYGGFDGDVLSCRAVMTIGEDEMYMVADWKKKVSDDRVAIIHLLTVSPDYRHQGLSKRLLEYLFKEAEKTADVVHLDVLEGNLPADRLYLKMGFSFAGSYPAHYEDIGDCWLNLYEYDLKRHEKNCYAM